MTGPTPAFEKAVNQIEDVAALSVGADSVTIIYMDGHEERLEGGDARAFGMVCVFSSTEADRRIV